MQEELLWAPSPSPPTFCLRSRLLLKLAFLNLTYAKTILLKCFKFFSKFKIVDLIEVVLIFCKNLLLAESQKALGGFS